MIIFLDFDGVTHGVGNHGQDGIHYFDQCCLDSLSAAINGFNGVKIVIASTWKQEFSLEKLKHMLKDQLGSKVVGATPCVGEHNFADPYANRETECLAWLAENGIEDTSQCFAIDDKPEHYHILPVYGTDPAKGFCETDIGNLQIMMKGLMSG